MTANSSLNEPLEWAALSPDEQRVMAGAVEAASLAAIWSRWLPKRDLFFYNRGYRYVPQLMVAARRLIERDLIGVSRQEGPVSPHVDLSREEAMTAVNDINNWWRYDPSITADDPEDTGTNPVSGGAPYAANLQYYVFDPHRDERMILGYKGGTVMTPLPAEST